MTTQIVLTTILAMIGFVSLIIGFLKSMDFSCDPLWGYFVTPAICCFFIYLIWN